MNEASDSTPAESTPGESTPGESTPGESPAGESAPRDSDRGRPYRFLVAAVLTLLGLLAMAGLKSYRDLAVAQDMENELRREITETKARIRALTEHIDRVENDPATLERLAREELGMVREGDVVIVLPENGTEPNLN